MGKVFQGTSMDPGDLGQNNNLSRFWPFTCGYKDASSTTEANAQVTCRAGGVLSNMSALVSANTLTTATTTIVSRKGNADGGQSISILAGVSGLKTDASNTDTLAATNVYGGKITTASGGSGNIIVKSYTAVFNATTNTSVIFGGLSSGVITPSTASTTFFFFPTGDHSNYTATEGDVSLQTDVGGAFKNVQILITANTRGTTSTFNSRVGGSNGGQTISVTSGSTGLKEDTSNTDTLSATNLFNYSVVNGTGVGGMTISYVNGLFTNSTATKTNIFLGFNAGGSASYVRTASATRSFMYLLGGYVTNDTTENNEKIQHTYSVLNNTYRLNVSANAYTGTATATSRKNGAAGAQSISIASGSTGLKTDSSNTDSLAASDDFCFAIVDGTANTITMRWLSSQENSTTTGINTYDGLLKASTKTWDGLAIASLKTWNGIA